MERLSRDIHDTDVLIACFIDSPYKTAGSLNMQVIDECIAQLFVEELSSASLISF